MFDNARSIIPFCWHPCVNLALQDGSLLTMSINQLISANKLVNYY